MLRHQRGTLLYLQTQLAIRGGMSDPDSDKPVDLVVTYMYPGPQGYMLNLFAHELETYTTHFRAKKSRGTKQVIRITSKQLIPIDAPMWQFLGSFQCRGEVA